MFGGGAVEFDPASLFASGEEGAWYEPSTSTCFTDASGTVAATYGDAVQYLQDLSGNGNHATQTTLASRPILARVPETGRRNLLERTEEFDNATVWTEFFVTASATLETAPAGLSGTVYKLQESALTDQHGVSQIDGSLPTTDTWTLSVYIKDAGDGRFVQLRPFGVGSGVAYATFDPTDGSLTQSGGTALVGTPTSTPVGDSGWYRVEMTCSADLLSGDGAFIVLTTSGTAGEYPAYTGDGSSGVYIFGAQFEIGTSSTAYQKVVTEYDITEAGVTSLEYLSFDGVDDALIGPSHPFTFTGPVSVFTGAKPESFNVFSTIFSAGTTGVASSNTQKSMGFGMFGNSSNKWSTDIWLPSGVYSEPVLIAGTNYVALFNILNWSTHRSAGTEARVNGVDRAVTSYGGNNPTSLNSGKMVVGSFDPTALSSGFFNGNLYGLIVRGASSTTDEITNTEAYLAARSGVTL